MPKSTGTKEVGGFAFQNEDEAKQAETEVDGIRYIRTKIDKDDPDTVLQVYNQMIAQKIFETAVGYSYLKELQEYLMTVPAVKNEEIFPIPVTHPKLEESLRKQRKEFAHREKLRIAKEKEERLKEKQKAEKDKEEPKRKLKLSVGLNVALAFCIVVMFVITLTSDSPTILDYQSKLLNRYAAWEQELTEREHTVKEREQQLGIESETSQNGFTE